MSSNPTSSVDSVRGISVPYTLDEMVLMLRYLFEREQRMRVGLEADSQSLENPKYQEVLKFERKQLEQWDALIKEKLENFLAFPPHHSKHMSKIADFHSVASYDDSIFIITKFPDGDNELDNALRRIITAVKIAIRDCGFYPRIASEYDYHPLLWDNVELYLLCCGRGVAIVEDRYKPELNPNVAMEWGWMRGMGKNVLFLVEKAFRHYRADWSGLTEYSFAWDEPENDIKQAIEKWLERKKL